MSFGGGGETLFLTSLSGAAENTSDDLDAAETGGMLVCFQ